MHSSVGMSEDELGEEGDTILPNLRGFIFERSDREVRESRAEFRELERQTIIFSSARYGAKEGKDSLASLEQDGRNFTSNVSAEIEESLEQQLEESLELSLLLLGISILRRGQFLD